MLLRAVIFSIFLLLTIFTSSNGQQAVGITIVGGQGGMMSGMGGMMMGMMMGGMNTYYNGQYYNW